MMLAPSSLCSARTLPNLSDMPIPPVKPIAATGSPRCNASRSPRTTTGPRHSGTCKKHTSWLTSECCSVTFHRRPLPEMRIIAASRITWQFVTTIDGATVTPVPRETPPRSRVASTRTTLAWSAIKLAGCSDAAAAMANCCSATTSSTNLIDGLTAIVDQGNAVLAENAIYGCLVFRDELFDRFFPFALAVTHAHCHRVVEFDARLRAQRNDDQLDVVYALRVIAGD